MPTTKKVASKKSILKKQKVSLYRAKKVSTVKLIAKKTAPVVQKKPKTSGILKSTNKKILQKPAKIGAHMHSKFEAIEALHNKNKGRVTDTVFVIQKNQKKMQRVLSPAVLSPYRFPLDVHGIAVQTARISGIFFVVAGAIFTVFFAGNSFQSVPMLASVNESFITEDTVALNCQDPLLFASVSCKDSVNKTPTPIFDINGVATNLVGSVRVRVTVPFASRVKLSAYYKTDTTQISFGSMVKQSGDIWELYVDTTKQRDGEYQFKVLIENAYGSYEVASPSTFIFLNHPVILEPTIVTASSTVASTKLPSETSSTTEKLPSAVVLKSDVSKSSSSFGFEIKAVNATDVKIYATNVKTNSNQFLGNAYRESNDIWKYRWTATSLLDGQYTIIASALIEGVPTTANTITVEKITTAVVSASSTVTAEVLELQPEVSIVFQAKQPLFNIVDVKIDVDGAAYIELYSQGKTSLIKKYLGVAKAVDTHTWMYRLDTKQIPNGEYLVVVNIKNSYGTYEDRSTAFSVLNTAVVAVTQIEADTIKSLEIVAEEVEQEKQDTSTTLSSEVTAPSKPDTTLTSKNTDITLEIQEVIDKQLKLLANAIRLNDTKSISLIKQNLDALKMDIAASQKAGTPAETLAAADVYIREIILMTEDAVQFTQKIISERTKEKASEDSDKDGVSNYDEVVIYKTNPFEADTDKDGFIDSAEILSGFNPTDSNREALVVFQSPKELGIVRDDIFEVTSITTAVIDDPQEQDVQSQPVAIISGKALPNSFVTLYVFSTPIVVTVKTEEDGSWSYRFDKELEDGAHEIYVGVTDNAGKIVAKSNAFAFIKEAQAFTGVTNGSDEQTAPISTVNNSFLSEYMVYLVVSISTVAIGLVIILLGLHLDSRKKNVVIENNQQEVLV